MRHMITFVLLKNTRETIFTEVVENVSPIDWFVNEKWKVSHTGLWDGCRIINVYSEKIDE